MSVIYFYFINKYLNFEVSLRIICLDHLYQCTLHNLFFFFKCYKYFTLPRLLPRHNILKYSILYKNDD